MTNSTLKVDNVTNETSDSSNNENTTNSTQKKKRTGPKRRKVTHGKILVK